MSTDFSCFTFIKSIRKERKCTWCAQPIGVGSKAARFACRWEGDFSASVLHMECHHAMQAAETEEGWLPHEYGRGRTDDDKHAAPEFDADGNRLETK